MGLEIESMVRYASPINAAMFSHMTFLLLGVGMFFTSWSVVYEIASLTRKHDFREYVLSLMASVFYGLGTILLLVWIGIYF